MESIWRLLRQRLKSRGVITNLDELRRVIEEDWSLITLGEMNKTIASMPDRVAAVSEYNGLPTPC